jgi:hypothetical protein
MAAYESASRNRQVRSHLEAVIATLRQVYSVIPVAVAALRHQNADIDDDVAALLQHSVGAELEDQIGKLEAVLPLLSPPARARRKR